jgi:two-component system, NtrC family, sensor kinase
MQSMTRFAVLTDSADLAAQFKKSDIQIINSIIEKIEFLAIDLRKKDLDKLVFNSAFTEAYIKAKKIIFVFENKQMIPYELLTLRAPDQYIEISEISDHTFLQAQEEFEKLQQDEVYLHLSADLNSQYEILKLDLEQKLSDHQKNLIESRQKILDTNNRSEALRKILYALHQESDITRVESVLNDLLPSTSNATWIKIIPQNIKIEFETDFKKQLGLSFQNYNMNEYLIYFIKGDQKNFKKTDLELFQKIRDALILNLTRNQNLSDLILAEKILSEAFATFPHPLALIDNDYNVINSNLTFQKHPKEKCYEMLFNQDSPCQGCHLGQQFQVHRDGQTFQVTSNAFINSQLKSSDRKNIWVNTYTDRTQEIELEQKITQNAKMKDLGLISSSIAHELNNPLGGIISYLQILQMEINKDSDLQQDLSAMIQTSMKMKKIIEDLLVFSRRPQPGQQTTELISDVIKETLSENELLFKAQNLKVVHTFDEGAGSAQFTKSIFKDSMYFIFQFFIDRTQHIKKTKKNFTGLVEIKFFQNATKRTLRFVGNFGPLENDYKLKNVQFLAIHKSLMDQGFHVELTELDQTWVAVDVVFPSKN